MSWLQYAGVFAAFFATHSIPVRPKNRNAIVRRIGERYPESALLHLRSRVADIP
ncbi:MAG: hypothetical protein KIH44_009085 [Octadecabacter sp.]|nr:hypothetical protein [Octadecabacter sp.]